MHTRLATLYEQANFQIFQKQFEMRFKRIPKIIQISKSKPYNDTHSTGNSVSL